MAGRIVLRCTVLAFFSVLSLPSLSRSIHRIRVVARDVGKITVINRIHAHQLNRNETKPKNSASADKMCEERVMKKEALDDGENVTR